GRTGAGPAGPLTSCGSDCGAEGIVISSGSASGLMSSPLGGSEGEVLEELHQRGRLVALDRVAGTGNRLDANRREALPELLDVWWAHVHRVGAELQHRRHRDLRDVVP